MTLPLDPFVPPPSISFGLFLTAFSYVVFFAMKTVIRKETSQILEIPAKF